MRPRLLLFAYGFLAWTIFFLVARALFLLYHNDLTRELTLSDTLLTFVHGIRMDWAAAGYLSLLPGLILATTFFVRGKYLWPFWLGYHTIILLLASFVVIIDLELYKHWGFRMDATPLLYAGKEAAGSGEFWTTVLLIVYWLVVFGVGLILMIKFFKPRVQCLEPVQWITGPALLVTTAMLVIPIRGSFGVAPMNTGFVYFHKANSFANHAAINVVWNFGYAVHKMNRLRYPNNYFDADKANVLLAELYPPAVEPSPRLITTDTPNIMIIMLESYTFKFIEPLGGLPGIAPRFNALVKEGMLFDNFYSSGDRTDKGLISVLSSYPAQPLASIIKYPNKTKNLPFLNQVFKARGYHTEFTYGYNIDYGNFRSYLINAGFDNLTHSEHFPQDLNTSKWGVHDHYVFEKFFEETEQVQRPFFKIIMTQSSHEPFEVPMETVIEGEDDLHKFLNSAYYTDRTLGEFIDKAKQTDWWSNTLVIITADHGHPMPDNNGLGNPHRYKIPMLWLGGALAKQDTVVHSVAGHTDIANTLLGQLGMHDDRFIFSQDIFNPAYRPFAAYIFNNGFGFVQEGNIVVYDNNGKSVLREEGDVNTHDVDLGKAFIQKLYWDYNAR
jgi:phosphoglycerol transferase MdoB-like AlkP superfamily enzyme